VLNSITYPPDSTKVCAELQKYLVTLFGQKRTASLLSTLRQPGPYFYLRTNTLRTTNEELIALLAEDGIQAHIYEPTLGAIAIPIKQGPPVPHYDKIVVADKPSSENVLLGSHLYRPGVIRSDSFQEGDSVTVVNPCGHIVGSGIGAGNSAELQAQKTGLFVRVTHPFYALPSLADLAASQAGLFYSQSLPAMLVAPILNPKPGETVIDFCAAPGGKTTHIAQLTQNQCRIFAVDRSEGRLSRLETEAKKLGVTCVKTFVGRANEFCAQYPDVSADRIIVDPPCTALGVRPKLFDLTTFARIRSTASYQRMILDSAIETLRPGGILVYSTCTLTVEENEHNIQYLIESQGFKLEPQTPYLGEGGIDGDLPLGQGVQRFYPDYHDLPGYFIAKLRKPVKSGS